MGLYVKLDVNYFDDPKVTSVTSDAELLFVRSLCYCKRLLSDGFIALSQLPRLASDIGTDSDSDSLAKELTSVGLWNDEPGGWRIAAWSNHNDLADEVEAKRKAKRDGGALGNHKRWHQGKRGSPSADCRYCESEGLIAKGSVGRSVGESPETEVEVEVEKPSPEGGADAPTLVHRVASWLATEHNVEIGESPSLHAMYDQVMRQAMPRLEGKKRHDTAMGLVCDYATEVIGEKVPSGHRSRIGRLLKAHLPEHVLYGVAQSLDWGAGLKGEHAKDPDAWLNYVTTVVASREAA